MEHGKDWVRKMEHKHESYLSSLGVENEVRTEEDERSTIWWGPWRTEHDIRFLSYIE